MFLPLSTLWQISRPRFWIYVFGPYIVGMLIGAPSLEALRSPLIVLGALFFTLPANLLIYGVNDIFDYETDRLNPKKTGYETLVAPDIRPALWRSIALCCLPFLPIAFFPRSSAPVAMAAFLFFSLCYSAPPIRAKTKPILDSVFNVLYIFPGVYAFYLAGGTTWNPQPFIAAWLWAMAMHAYSAVPDITADRKSGMATVATFLGLRGTLLFCLALYLGSAALSYPDLTWLSVVLGSIYTVLMLLSLRAGTEPGIMRLYRWFPLINTLSGAALFWFVAINKFF